MKVSGQLKAGGARLLLACAGVSACASTTGAPANPATVSTATHPVEFEAVRGAYSYEFHSEHVVAIDTLQVAPALAWSAVSRAYRDVGLPQGEVREGTTTYGIARASVRRSLAGAPLSRFMTCGSTMGVPNANSYDVTLSIITKLVPLPPSATIVQSQMVANARQTGVVTNPLPCTTTRDLERRIARLIEFHAVQR